MDWLIREYTPTWLERAGLQQPAAALRSLPAVLDESTLAQALGPLERARLRARGARTADRSAPWTAARSAARETAWACAGAAAWAAARVSVADLSGERARAAARATAADAATVIAREALPARRPRGRAATKDATRSILAPSVRDLRGSVLALLERMLPTEPVAAADESPRRLGGSGRSASSQDLYRPHLILNAALTQGGDYQRMDVLAVVLALVSFALLFALISGIERI